jgi:hypothetical protein
MHDMSSSTLPNSVDAVIDLLATENYVCDRQLGTALFLGLTLKRPLFLEGAPGVGKTELGKTRRARRVRRSGRRARSPTRRARRSGGLRSSIPPRPGRPR